MKVKPWILSALLFSSLMFAKTAEAKMSHGAVAYVPPSCDHFIMYSFTSYGYALLEWYGGNLPTEGENWIGNFESYGFHSLHWDDDEMRVYVEDYMMNADDAMEELWERCD